MGRTTDGTNLRTIDHSRLTTILWGVCKNQQKQIADITARLNALTVKPTKKNNC